MSKKMIALTLVLTLMLSFLTLLPQVATAEETSATTALSERLRVRN